MQRTVNERRASKPKAQADRAVQYFPANLVTDGCRDLALTDEAGDYANGGCMLEGYKKCVQNPPVNKS